MKPFGKVSWGSASEAGSGFAGGDTHGGQGKRNHCFFTSVASFFHYYRKSAELFPWKSLPAKQPLPPGARAGPGKDEVTLALVPLKWCKIPKFCARRLVQDGARRYPCWSLLNDGARCDVPPRRAPNHGGPPHGCEGTSDAQYGESSSQNADIDIAEGH